MDQEVYDVLIIGSGIAGLTAALYSARQGLKTIIVSADLGGQLVMAPEIQNFPGFESIRGYELIQRVEAQVRAYDVEVVYDEIQELSRQGEYFVAKGLSSEYRAFTVVLACGKAPKELGVPGEKELRGKGVSYCVVCDAPLFKGRTVALVGWGHHGWESVNTLAGYARKVYWVFPSAEPYDDEEAVRSLLSRGVVELVPRAQLVAVKGSKRVEALVVRNRDTDEEREIQLDGVFIEIGYEPKTGFLKGFVNLNDKGEVVVDREGRTSMPGVFAAGDVTDMPYKQAVIAAGMGSIAALSAYKYLMEVRGKKVAVLSDWRHGKR
ncbi:MAG: FAD-dependent oxidoreductase [Thermofilaceae archaeon]|nr:FAD-dependent oxidoreductase [Thermofilaceae archaeon]MCX8180313.1 FAD-dependent oxidoreductase [Thermofilaceae archaeon]MDW8003848.1 FAD-dependent oxidoreductase [Thermofilaceae archaeon]